MLAASRDRILATVASDARVLDVGGWAIPFPRADAVLDRGPYATRGAWGWDGDRADERYDASTWTELDICAREPWPYADGEFDFAICSHTLEDVRDPLWVCAELSRVARAGYVEVPARVEEQTWGFQGPWTGWGHHHWLIERRDEALEFVFKHHVVHAPEFRLPVEVRERLSPAERVTTLWWEGAIEAHERIFDAPAELNAYLRELVEAHAPAPTPPRRLRRFRRAGV